MGPVQVKAGYLVVFLKVIEHFLGHPQYINKRHYAIYFFRTTYNVSSHSFRSHRTFSKVLEWMILTLTRYARVKQTKTCFYSHDIIHIFLCRTYKKSILIHSSFMSLIFFIQNTALQLICFLVRGQRLSYWRICYFISCVKSLNL